MFRLRDDFSTNTKRPGRANVCDVTSGCLVDQRGEFPLIPALIEREDADKEQEYTAPQGELLSKITKPINTKENRDQHKRYHTERIADDKKRGGNRNLLLKQSAC